MTQPSRPSLTIAPDVSVFGDGTHSYLETTQTIKGHAATSAVLRRRIIEDESRDVLDALSDAEQLHALQSMRFGEAPPVAGVAAGPDAGGIEAAGVDALRRLYKVACGHSGQCSRIARFLLGLYNGDRYPFDLTELRGIDDALYDDCIRVLNIDARLTRREVHAYFEQGGAKWEALADHWRVVDMRLVRIAAKQLAERVGFSGPAGQAAAELLTLLEGKQGAVDD